MLSNNNISDVWIYESPDGGKTITKRKAGMKEKVLLADPIEHQIGIDIYEKVVKIIGKQE
jgi:hypothetical protein